IRSRTASRRAGSAQKPAPPCRTASYPAERGILPAYAEASRLSGIRMAGRRQVPPPLSARKRGKILAAVTEPPRSCRCRGEEVAEPEAVEIGGAKPVAQGESFFGAVVFGGDVDAEGALSFRERHDPGDLAGDIGWVRAGVRHRSLPGRDLVEKPAVQFVVLPGDSSVRRVSRAGVVVGPGREGAGHNDGRVHAEAGELEVPIAATFPLDRVQDAYRRLDEGHVLGMIVLLP